MIDWLASSSMTANWVLVGISAVSVSLFIASQWALDLGTRRLREASLFYDLTRGMLSEMQDDAPVVPAHDCECCLGTGLQGDGETPCPCTEAA